MGKYSFYSFVFDKLKPYKKWFVLTVLSRFCWAICSSLWSYMSKLIIDKMAGFVGPRVAIMGYIWSYMAIFLGLWLVISCCYRIWSYVEISLYPFFCRDVTLHMFSYLTGHASAYFQKNLTGGLQNKVTDMTVGAYVLVKRLEEFMGVLALFMIALGTLTLYKPIFGLFLLIWCSFFMLVSYYYAGIIEKKSRAFSEARTYYIGSMADSIANIVNVHLFARRGFEIAQMKKKVDMATEKEREMGWNNFKLRVIWDISMIVTFVLMCGNLLWCYSRGEATVGDFSFVLLLTLQIFKTAWWFFVKLLPVAEHIGRSKQAYRILEKAHGVADVPNASVLVVNKGEIVFDDVSFGYEEGRRIFKRKRLQIGSGEKIGLVGFSGSGKSTFVNLLLRLFDVERGTIRIDGQDIRMVKQESLRAHIAVIPQDTLLFHRSLMENIRYGRLEASDEEVLAAARQAGCDSFVEALPAKYATLVGERGLNLSGGQRQRIAIARAILKDAPILILDEATSALDSVTEEYIQRGLYRLMKGRTTIVIAHRLSTLAAMDRILVFEDGDTVEEGSHEMLLKRGGQYARMWKMQAGGFLPEEDGAG